MKKFLLAIVFCLSAVVQAQVVYHDASKFPVLGKATENTLSRYERLPGDMESGIRQQLWDLGRNSAGLTIRFRTNSTQVSARWETRNNFRMNHMTATGICGLDLYCLVDGDWVYAGTGIPQGKQSKATLVKNITAEDREFMLHLPLYDGPIALEIGVDSLATLLQPAVDLPVRKNPVVFYGTSILQGGCATRPGMCHTNILQRRLQRECINLGFSGNARLDYEIARLMASVKDASLFVIDCLPNVTPEKVRESMEQFYRIIRESHPETPILFVENPPFPNNRFNQQVAKELEEEDALLAEIVEKIKKDGDKQVFLFTNEQMIGVDGEATVDACHFTDLGFMRYADGLEPVLRKLLK